MLWVGFILPVCMFHFLLTVNDQMRFERVKSNFQILDRFQTQASFSLDIGSLTGSRSDVRIGLNDCAVIEKRETPLPGIDCSCRQTVSVIFAFSHQGSWISGFINKSLRLICFRDAIHADFVMAYFCSQLSSKSTSNNETSG